MTTGFFDGAAAHTLLMQYSKWLDLERVSPSDPMDFRTHEDFVDRFIAQRAPRAWPMLERPEPGCGRCINECVGHA